MKSSSTPHVCARDHVHTPGPEVGCQRTQAAGYTLEELVRETSEGLEQERERAKAIEGERESERDKGRANLEKGIAVGGKEVRRRGSDGIKNLVRSHVPRIPILIPLFTRATSDIDARSSRARARTCVVCKCVFLFLGGVCVRECCVNQPCDDDDGRSTVSTVPLPLAHVVAWLFLARRSIRGHGVESLSRKSARGGERGGSSLPFPTKIASPLSLSRDGVLWPRFDPALLHIVKSRNGSVKKRGGRAVRWDSGRPRSIEDVSRRR